MKRLRLRHGLLLLSVLLFLARASAQFIDDFNSSSVQIDPDGLEGWMFRAGDGTATMDFRQGGHGYASILVVATTDKWHLVGSD